MKLVHCPLADGLLHLVQWEGDWRGRRPPRPLLAVLNVTSPSINGQFINQRIMIRCSAVLMCPLKLYLATMPVRYREANPHDVMKQNDLKIYEIGREHTHVREKMLMTMTMTISPCLAAEDFLYKNCLFVVGFHAPISNESRDYSKHSTSGGMARSKKPGE